MGIGVFTATVLSATVVLQGNLPGLFPGQNSAIENLQESATLTQSLQIAQGFIGCSAMLTANDPSSRINLRSAPSTSARQLGYGLAGDRLTILDTANASDGYMWYKVRFENPPNAEGWIRGDFVRALENCVVSQVPDESPSRERESLQRPPREDSTPPENEGGTGANRLFSNPEIDYFLEVALGSEYGGSSSTVRRWEEDICIQLHFPEAEDISQSAERAVRATVDTVIDDINDSLQELADDLAESMDGLDAALNSFEDWEPIEVATVEDGCDDPNLEFYYVQAENFQTYNRNARGGQVGHVWTWWSQYRINRARVLVASNYLTEEQRDHVIREEITQSLGILKDSWEDADSIFYQGWTSTTEYTDTDIAVIKMLYHPAIRAGMNAMEAQTELSRL